MDSQAEEKMAFDWYMWNETKLTVIVLCFFVCDFTIWIWLYHSELSRFPHPEQRKTGMFLLQKGISGKPVVHTYQEAGSAATWSDGFYLIGFWRAYGEKFYSDAFNLEICCAWRNKLLRAIRLLYPCIVYWGRAVHLGSCYSIISEAPVRTVPCWRFSVRATEPV